MRQAEQAEGAADANARGRGAEAELGTGAGRGSGIRRRPRRWQRLCEGNGVSSLREQGVARGVPGPCLVLFFILWWGRRQDRLHGVKRESYLEGKLGRTRWRMGEGSRLQAQRKGGPSQAGGREEQEERGPALI